MDCEIMFTHSKVKNSRDFLLKGYTTKRKQFQFISTFIISFLAIAVAD